MSIKTQQSRSGATAVAEIPCSKFPQGKRSTRISIAFSDLALQSTFDLPWIFLAVLAVTGFFRIGIAVVNSARSSFPFR
jgi:hypothetical protein